MKINRGISLWLQGNVYWIEEAMKIKMIRLNNFYSLTAGYDSKLGKKIFSEEAK